MSEYGSFYDPSMDDALFEEVAPSTGPSQSSSTTHALDGSICSLCGVVHEVSGHEDLPQEGLDELSKLLDELPPEMRANSEILVKKLGKFDKLEEVVSVVATVVGELYSESMKECDSIAMNVTVLTLLNELTEGRAFKELKFSRARTQLLYTRHHLSFLQQISESIDPKNYHGPLQSFASFIKFIEEVAEQSVSDATELYIKACEELSRGPEEAVLNSTDLKGVLPDHIRALGKDLFQIVE